MRLPAILLLCLLPLLPAYGEEPDLSARLRASYRAGRWDEAIELARQAMRSDPGEADMSYTLACLFSLSNQPDSAFTWLENAVRAGFTDYQYFQFDSDLDNIRQLPGYAPVMQLARHAAIAENERKSLDLTLNQWTPFTVGTKGKVPWVEGSLSFDDEALRIRAEVHDRHFKDGDRAWRYGDGFTINFAAPAATESVYTDRFHAFGFSLEKGEPVGVLINRDGTFRLKKVEALQPRIRAHLTDKAATYEIAIPWTEVYPFHPLLDSLAGINIIYNSQGDAGARTIIMYVPNSKYDTEATPLRRFAPLRFHSGDAAVMSVAGRLETRLISGDQVEATIAVSSPRDTVVSVIATVRDTNAQPVWTYGFTDTLAAGRNVMDCPMPVPGGAGAYQCAMVLGDSLAWRESFYKYHPDSLAALERRLTDAPSPAQDPAKRNSRDALAYRVRVLKASINSFTPRSDLAAVQREFEDLSVLSGHYFEQGMIYARAGYVLSAFRSPSDSTLQPFSIVLPDSFSPDSTYHLLVVLHGSGVDEVGSAQSVAQSPLWRDWIVVAPRGRNLSGWYLGQDETDALDLIRLATQLFHVDRTVCYGFSMGGYGVWRLTLLHPELFDAAICVSGSTVAWGVNPEVMDLSRQLGKPSGIKYLVIHGTEDKAVNIAGTDQFVTRLKQKQYDVVYVRVPGGGHGDFSTREIVEGWLHAQFPRDYIR